MRLFLYLVVLQIALSQIGLPASLVQNIVSLIIYVFVLLVAALIFFGSKDRASDWIAGIYLKTSGMLKPGQRLFVDNADGEVVGMFSFSAMVDTGRGYYVTIPYAHIVGRETRLKKSRLEVKSLEKLRERYIAKQDYYLAACLEFLWTRLA